MPLVITTDNKVVDCRTELSLDDLKAIVKGEVRHQRMLADIAYEGEEPRWVPDTNVYTNVCADGLPINMSASRRLKLEDSPVYGTTVLVIGPSVDKEIEHKCVICKVAVGPGEFIQETEYVTLKTHKAYVCTDHASEVFLVGVSAVLERSIG